MPTPLCAALLLASFAATRMWCRGSWFNPLTAFFAVWMVNLSLYELDGWLQMFNVRLDGRAESILSLSLICVFLGACIGIMGARAGTREAPLAIDVAVLDRMQVTAAVLFAVFTAGVAWRYWVTVGVYGPMFENLPTIREGVWGGDLAVPTASRLMTLTGYMVVLNVTVLAVFRPRPLFLLWIVAIVLLNFVSDLTIGARGSTFNAMLLAGAVGLVALRVRHGRTRVRHLAAGSVIALGGLALISLMLYLRSDGGLTFLERALLDNYVYMLGPIPTMVHFLENPWPSELPGQWTFAGIYQAIDSALGGGILTTEPFQTYYAPVIDLGPFNVANHVVYLYSDFGESGVALLSGAIGLVAGYTFVRAARLKRVADIQLAGLLMFLVIFSVRGLVTNGLMFWVCLGFVMIQHVVSTRRQRSREGTGWASVYP